MRHKKKKKRIKLLPIIIIIGLIVGIGLCLYLVSPVSTKNDKVIFNIESNTPTVKIIKNLKKKNLIKSEKFTLLFVKLNNYSNIQAGNFELNRNLSLRKIFDILTDSSKIKEDTMTITFKEGKNIRGIVDVIKENTKIDENEIYNTLKDTEYIKSLIEEYWFLTDEILNENIYYPLEGYLSPNTYEFSKKATIKDIFKRMLDQEEIVLDKYKKLMDKEEYSIHKLITLASVAELEGNTLEDRKKIVGVFYNRIHNNIPLGSDVTAYYAAKIDMGDRDLYQDEIISTNPYNTRSMSSAGKLPVGPICNPSEEAIDATLNYTENDYFYFVSDKNGKIYFGKTENEHVKIIEDLKSKGLWFEY